MKRTGNCEQNFLHFTSLGSEVLALVLTFREGKARRDQYDWFSA